MIEENVFVAQEGVTHINMKETSTTVVGRTLWMGASNRFKHPVFGDFDSLEAFWYYIRSSCKNDELRYHDEGYARRTFVAVADQNTVKIHNFQEIIGEAIFYMLMQMPSEKLNPILDNELPLYIYHIIESKDDEGNVVYTVAQHLRHSKWFVPLMEHVIQLIRDDKLYPPVDYGDLPNHSC